jgi:hypothetical protein
MRPNQMLVQNHTKDTERVGNCLLISLRFLEQDDHGMHWNLWSVPDLWVGKFPINTSLSLGGFDGRPESSRMVPSSFLSNMSLSVVLSIERLVGMRFHGSPSITYDCLPCTFEDRDKSEEGISQKDSVHSLFDDIVDE